MVDSKGTVIQPEFFTLKFGNANLSIGGLQDVIQEKGVPIGHRNA